MNIQLFGKKKCFDTKKAERWFKERRIKFQSVDLLRFGLSGGEFDSVRAAAHALVKVKATVTPDAALAALYAERYARFRLIYPAMKPLFKTLAR